MSSYLGHQARSLAKLVEVRDSEAVVGGGSFSDIQIAMPCPLDIVRFAVDYLQGDRHFFAGVYKSVVLKQF